MTDCRVRKWLLEKQMELNQQMRGARGEDHSQFMQIQLDLGSSGRRHEEHCRTCLSLSSDEPSAFPDPLAELEAEFDCEDELDRIDDFDRSDQGDDVSVIQLRRVKRTYQN